MFSVPADLEYHFFSICPFLLRELIARNTIEKPKDQKEIERELMLGLAVHGNRNFQDNYDCIFHYQNNNLIT